MDIKTNQINKTTLSSSRAPGGRRLVLGVLGVIVLLGLLYFFGEKKLFNAPDGSTYQAVFLNSGQVYFGKLSFFGTWLTLKDVYYLQATDALQAGTAASLPTNGQQKIQLVKLGGELHGPTDEMNIPKDKILFWENMRSDSKVIEAINQYKTKTPQ
jgi:hypothetical protein